MVRWAGKMCGSLKSTRSQTAFWSTRPRVHPTARDRSSSRISVMRSNRRNNARDTSPVWPRSSQRFHNAGNSSNPESPLSGFGSIAVQVDQEPTLVGVTHYPDRFRGASEGGCGDIAQLAEFCWGRHGVKLHQQLRNDLGRR